MHKFLIVVLVGMGLLASQAYASELKIGSWGGNVRSGPSTEYPIANWPNGPQPKINNLIDSRLTIHYEYYSQDVRPGHQDGGDATAGGPSCPWLCSHLAAQAPPPSCCPGLTSSVLQ